MGIRVKSRTPWEVEAAMVAPRARVDYSPVVGRPPIRWPNGARLAVWVVPNIEHYEYMPPGATADRNPGTLLPLRVPPPDILDYSLHDYGNRVGLWRVADITDAFGIRCTVSLNMAVLDHYPEIAEAIRVRRWAIMSHGIYNTRFLYGYSEEQEREFYAETFAILRRHLPDYTLKGMFGPGGSATERTPDLMAEAGLIYHADWAHDDQPVPLKVARGRLISMPYSFELNDGLLFRRSGSGDDYEEGLKAQFDRLYMEGAESGRVLCIPLHPDRLGQPHFIGNLRRVLEHIASHQHVWFATGDEIADHYIAHHYDEAVAFAARFQRVRKQHT